MAICADFHSQLGAIMELLANTTVAEICQLVDEGFATLRLEVSRSQRENLALKSRLQLMEKTVLQLTKEKSRCNQLESTDALQSQKVKCQVEQEVVGINKERLEEELIGCCVLDDYQTVPNTCSMYERL